MRFWLVCGVLSLMACKSADPPTVLPAPDAATTAAGTLPTVVFLGDSLTAGLGLSEEEAVPALIQKKVNDRKLAYRVINAGRSGDTTAGGLARLDWYLRDDVNLRVLVIGLGSNDAMRGLSLPAMEQNLKAIITKTRAYRADVKILLWAMQTFPNMGPEYRGGYEAVFARVGKDANVTLIPFPLVDVAAKPELNQADGIHPTKEGTVKVADRIWAVLESAL